MVKDNQQNEDEVTITNTNDENLRDTELSDIEAATSTKLQTYRERILKLENEKRAAQDELQRVKADFLNARKRLEQERERDFIRYQKQHIEQLLPLCDSFEMAMNDEGTWKKADVAWRKGIEGMYSQLGRLLSVYGVVAVKPIGMPFNPHQHEAVGTEAITDPALQDTVISVLQSGYELQTDTGSEIIRPARVIIGALD